MRKFISIPMKQILTSLFAFVKLHNRIPVVSFDHHVLPLTSIRTECVHIHGLFVRSVFFFYLSRVCFIALVVLPLRLLNIYLCVWYETIQVHFGSLVCAWTMCVCVCAMDRFKYNCPYPSVVWSECKWYTPTNMQWLQWSLSALLLFYWLTGGSATGIM